MNTPKAGTYRILLVEDNDDHAELVQRSFRQSGERIEVIRVADGEEALDWVLSRKTTAAPSSDGLPDLILLDLRLPKIDGMDVLKRLKLDEDLRSIPIVVLTSSDAETDIARAYGQYANSYVVKPLDFQKLSQILRDLGFYWLDINQKPRRY